MAIKIQGDTVIYDDKVFKVGSGTTAQRPQTPTEGMIRYNTDLETFEGYSNGMWGAIGGGATGVFSYENRSALRALNPFENDQVIVESLGLFIWKSNSTELDDDESCFATTSGRWLLEMPHWDLIEAWQLVDREAASNLVGSATFENAITSVGAGGKISVNVYVPGATLNDIAVVNFNDKSYSGAPGMLYGVVTDLNKVTVYFCGIANGATSFPTGTYKVTVIKS